ncbi:hypothetical protein [Filimonas effusa]|uniref:Uncharacterized protein n=1 Tax=Filimonas effusa TaxID=2508721 RepID=A0A4Q1DB15_9BACT|nr:hypothetical protein [Filimonas effusa]RXK86622.1 hypothetical protein ESB13_07410 [Filimonas effusa]
MKFLLLLTSFYGRAALLWYFAFAAGGKRREQKMSCTFENGILFIFAAYGKEAFSGISHPGV